MVGPNDGLAYGRFLIQHRERSILMNLGKMYKSASVGLCALVLGGMAFAGGTTQASSGFSANGSLNAPLSGPDTRISNAAMSGNQREFAIDINPLDSKYIVEANIHGTLPNSYLAVYRSNDYGQTWTGQDANVFGFANTKDPSVAYSRIDGSVYVGGINTAGPLLNWLSRSTDNGATFRAATSVTIADRPTIVIDNSPSSANYGTVYVFGHQALGGPNNRIVYAKSNDTGLTWSSPQFVSSPPPAAGYNHSAMPVIASDGTIYVSFQEYSTSAACGSGNIVFNKLAKSTDGGATWTESVIGSGPITQGGSCVGAQAGRGIFCINGAGQSFRSRSQAVIGVKPSDPNTLYAIYSGGDLESAYVCGGGSGFHSDSLFRSSTDGGATWTAATKINGDAQGSDQFFPWLEVAPNGTIWTGWQDRREDPNNYMMRWYQAYSFDNGTTWTEAPVADSMSLADTFIGDYHGLAAGNGQVFGVFLDTRDNLNGDPYIESHVLTAHAAFQGHPGGASTRNVQPMSLQVKLSSNAGPATNYATQTSDQTGNIVVPAGLPEGTYNWRAKSPKFLANAGTSISLGGALNANLDMGTMRGGDADDSNVINVGDFNILRASFGFGVGDPSYDVRADFNDDGVVNSLDYTILAANFSQAGAPPIN